MDTMAVVESGQTTKRRRLHRLLLLVAVMLLVVGVVFLGLSRSADGATRDILLAFGVALVAGAIIDIIFEVFLESVLDSLVKQAAEEIKIEISQQTTGLISTSKSLHAMSASGIVQIYKDRDAAAVDMLRDITHPSVSHIRLIGISLNDFARPEDPYLGQAWSAITEFVSGEHAVGRSLDIKILVIDPDCLGAQLRALGETQGALRRRAGRLKDDVENTVEMLEALKQAAQGTDRVLFDYRLCVLPPILFLCRTDSSSYIQQYYFWSARDDPPPIPVFLYRALPGPRAPAGMHQAILDHFDWIWEKASVPGPKDGRTTRTIDKAIHQLGNRSVFVDSGEALEYIRRRLRQARDRVYVQGISLGSFFDPQRPLFQEVCDLPERGIDVRILLLDPESEQAYYRSFREHLLENPTVTFDAYRSGGDHTRSPLFSDTNYTFNKICNRLQNELSNGSIHVRTYTSAPACFMLLVDDSVLVEQYVYGKVAPTSGRPAGTILGKDMPLVEYAREPSELFPGADPLRNPFLLVLNHFEFVFEKCARPIQCQAPTEESVPALSA